MFKLLIKTSIAALVMASVMGPALADEFTAGNASVTVNFADLNLNTLSGAHALLSRIKSAAKRVCGPTPGLRDISAFADWRQCIQNSTASAVHKLANPLVSDLYQGGDSHLVIAQGH